VEWAAGTS